MQNEGNGKDTSRQFQLYTKKNRVATIEKVISLTHARTLIIITHSPASTWQTNNLHEFYRNSSHDEHIYKDAKTFKTVFKIL